jgi:hypothetical protein
VYDRSLLRSAQVSVAQRISWEDRAGPSVHPSSLLLLTCPARCQLTTCGRTRPRHREREPERERKRKTHTHTHTHTHVDRMTGPSPARQRQSANNSSRLAPRSSAATLRRSSYREQNTMMAAIEWRVTAARVCQVFVVVFPDVSGHAHTIPSEHAAGLRRRAWHDHLMTTLRSKRTPTRHHSFNKNIHGRGKNVGGRGRKVLARPPATSKGVAHA